MHDGPVGARLDDPLMSPLISWLDDAVLACCGPARHFVLRSTMCGAHTQHIYEYEAFLDAVLRTWMGDQLCCKGNIASWHSELGLDVYKRGGEDTGSDIRPCVLAKVVDLLVSCPGHVPLYLSVVSTRSLARLAAPIALVVRCQHGFSPESRLYRHGGYRLGS